MMKSAKSWALMLGVCILAACGPDPAPSPSATPTPTTIPASGVCATIDRIVAARRDSPAFSTLPRDFKLTDGVVCTATTRDLAVGPDRTLTNFSVIECVYYDRDDVREEAGWPVWTEVMQDAAACFGGWQGGGQGEVTPWGPVRSLTFERAPDTPRITRPEGEIEPVWFTWTQDGRQRIVFQVLAE